jgi:hypothetical protein
MPAVPLDQLHGGFAFDIQGWMRAQHQGNQAYIKPKAEPFRVGLAIATNFKSAEWPQLPEVGELPVATAFYPSQYPPPKPPTTGLPAGPTYTPNVGYYPFAESGVMFFDNGQVNGVIRVDTAGWASPDFGSFQGKYEFHPHAPGVGLPAGIISIILDALKNHVWDYWFTMLSKTEVLLATGGCLPRPAVGTGSMRQIAPALLKWY